MKKSEVGSGEREGSYWWRKMALWRESCRRWRVAVGGEERLREKLPAVEEANGDSEKGAL